MTKTNIALCAAFGVGLGLAVALAIPPARPAPIQPAPKWSPPISDLEGLPASFWYQPRAHVPETAAIDLYERGDALDDPGRHYLGPERHRPKRLHAPPSPYEKERAKHYFKGG